MRFYPLGVFHEREDGALWDADAGPHSSEQLLREAEGHVRVLSGWSVDRDGFADENPRDEENRAVMSFEYCFFVQTYMLPILEAATDGRVAPQRLWQLAVARTKQYFCVYSLGVLPGVDYGPVMQDLSQYPRYLGNMTRYDLRMHRMTWTGTSEDIAEDLRTKGFWMWMRPDRSALLQ